MTLTSAPGYVDPWALQLLPPQPGNSHNGTFKPSGPWLLTGFAWCCCGPTFAAAELLFEEEAEFHVNINLLL